MQNEKKTTKRPKRPAPELSTDNRQYNIGMKAGQPTQDLPTVLQTVMNCVQNPFLFNSFHWVTHIENRELVFKSGIKHILGYDEKLFNFQKTLDIIHPSYRSFVTVYGQLAYQMVKEHPYRQYSTKSLYCIQYPIRHQKGHYVMVQMNAMVVQTDKKGIAICNYNRFDVLGPYIDMPILVRPRIYFNFGIEIEIAMRAEKEINERVRKIILDYLKFSKREKEVLTAYADADGDNDKLIVELAKLKSSKTNADGSPKELEKNTIKDYRDGAVKKARDKIWGGFSGINEVAHYLRKIEII